MKSKQDLTVGNINKKLWAFAIPLMLGNVMQQFYNLVDTWVVGKYIGDNALAAVGSSYSLMTFLTSVILGLCLGSSAFFSITFGEKNIKRLKNGMFISFVMIGIFSLILTFASFYLCGRIMKILQVPYDIQGIMSEYLRWIFVGIFATFLYNYFSNLLRGIGNSVIPLVFLCVSVILNIGLDLYFVLVLKQGIRGAAIATVISQYISGIGLMIYVYIRYPELRLKYEDTKFVKRTAYDIAILSGMTCLQQSVMNFGILMVQGLVNSFGTTVMAAFAAAVKIDTFAYLPVQDFGNAYSTFVAQNHGAGDHGRIRAGTKQAFIISTAFSVAISALVFAFARLLMLIFIDANETAVLLAGIKYLRIEGAFYFGIGCLFLLYGYFRAVQRPAMSVVLTVISLGTRVALAYILSAKIGEIGIWMAIPIGWLLADATGLITMFKSRRLQKQ